MFDADEFLEFRYKKMLSGARIPDGAISEVAA